MITKKMEIEGTYDFKDLIIESIASATGCDVEITPATGKGVVINLTDNAGASTLLILDSDAATVASINSNGVLTAVQGVLNTINAATGQHLAINGVTGKDIKFKVTDNAGARKVIFLDSDDSEVATIDSNGVITAVGGVTADVTGNLTGSVINTADAAIDFASGHADHTLTTTEKKAALLVVTNADQAANIIGPAENRKYVVRNASGQAITIKKTGATGVAVANGKTAVVMYSSTAADYVRVTADAEH